jgi:hypothetical protein
MHIGVPASEEGLGIYQQVPLDLNEVDCQKASVKGCVRLYVSISRPPDTTAHWGKRAYTHHHRHQETLVEL